MREKPPYLVNPPECSIAFDATEYGIIDGRFANTCLSHGDGNSFKWMAGGGEYSYVIKRVVRGFAKDDGTAASCWEFTQTDQSGNTEVAYVNTPQHEVLDFKGDPVSFKLINDISNAVIDISWEFDRLSEGLQAVFVEDSQGNELLIDKAVNYMPNSNPDE